MPMPVVEIPIQRLIQMGRDFSRDLTARARPFWDKLARVVGKVPFAEELGAGWYCARDPATPPRVKAVLLGAVAYFLMPADLIPDIVALVGFTDDATVLAAAMTVAAPHIRDRHRQAARQALGISQPEREEETNTA
ncbi:MAG: YkvA family protein [Alphaproteobacteria bacterium]